MIEKIKQSQRILIIGCPGSGKSTLAISLGKLLNIPVIHLDKLYWKPNWINVSREEFDEKLKLELIKPRWIIDGNFQRTLAFRLQYADLLIFLNFSTEDCLSGYSQRLETSKGKQRIDMTEGCHEEYDESFAMYIKNFNNVNLPVMNNVIAEFSGPVLKFNNRQEVEDFIKQLKIKN